MNRVEVRVGLIDAMGYSLEDLQDQYNMAIQTFYEQNPGVHILGLETREGPVARYTGGDDYRTLRGILTYEVRVDYPDPEPDPEADTAKDAQEATYATGIGNVVKIAGEVSLMRETGKAGGGMDYARLWKLIDQLGDEFRSLGGIVGGPDSGDQDPQV